MRASLNLETRNLGTSKQGHVSRLWQSLNYPPFHLKRSSFLFKAQEYLDCARILWIFRKSTYGKQRHNTFLDIWLVVYDVK